MKKLTALLLAAVLLLSLAACGAKPAGPAPKDAPVTEKAADPEPESDLAYVTGKGKLTVGITVYKPMDYKDEEGNWVGFDADMAQSFADNLGVDVEFVEIKWENKLQLLEDKTIDCIWNGMTLTDEVKETMECSRSYCRNTQTVVVPTKNAQKCQTVDDCKNLRFAVEAGSTGEAEVQKLGCAVDSVKTQAEALKKVAKGADDAAVVDSLMVAATVGEDRDYENLTGTVELNSEEFCVGFRKGSELANELNVFFAAAYADGFMQKVAETYRLQSTLLQQIA